MSEQKQLNQLNLNELSEAELDTLAGGDDWFSDEIRGFGYLYGRTRQTISDIPNLFNQGAGRGASDGDW